MLCAADQAPTTPGSWLLVFLIDPDTLCLTREGQAKTRKFLMIGSLSSLILNRLPAVAIQEYTELRKGGFKTVGY